MCLLTQKETTRKRFIFKDEYDLISLEGKKNTVHSQSLPNVFSSQHIIFFIRYWIINATKLPLALKEKGIPPLLQVENAALNLNNSDPRRWFPNQPAIEYIPYSYTHRDLLKANKSAFNALSSKASTISPSAAIRSCASTTAL